MGAVGGGEGGIEVAQGKIHLGEGVPGFKRVGGGGGGAGELGEGAVGVAEGVVGGGVFDEGLEVVGRHGQLRRERGGDMGKKKGRPCGPS